MAIQYGLHGEKQELRLHQLAAPAFKNNSQTQGFC
jgi:hypothetical protein